jgi:hypothetical protein
VLRVSWLLIFAMCGLARAQQTQLGAEFSKEGSDLTSGCNGFTFAKIGSCAEVLFTDDPLHIAVGSLAPQNGFGLGAALVTHYTPVGGDWRLNWDVDAVATPNGSWRAGAYMTAIWDRIPTIVAVPGGTPSKRKSNVAVREVPVFHLFAQTISLNTIDYFGEGPDTAESARSFFGMRETITGANVVFPIWKALNMSLLGEVNGRFVAIRPSTGQSSPSIDQLYTPATAPGLASQPAFAQFGEGLRIRPELAGGYIRLNYLVTFQEYVAPGASEYTFQRLTVDLSHQFPLYKTTRTLLPLDANGPDDCSVGLDTHSCPSITRNLEGSFGLRFWMNDSFFPAGHAVPFYFQPTLGGSDINGDPALASYQDYRFRAPNALLVRASFEHSVYKWPLGVTAMIDEGKVAFDRSGLDFTHLLHSYSAGLTLRAGGFPMVYLLFSWGGHEGTHTTAIMDTSLLGGATRPSLY